MKAMKDTLHMFATNLVGTYKQWVVSVCVCGQERLSVLGNIVHIKGQQGFAATRLDNCARWKLLTNLHQLFYQLLLGMHYEDLHKCFSITFLNLCYLTCLTWEFNQSLFNNSSKTMGIRFVFTVMEVNKESYFHYTPWYQINSDNNQDKKSRYVIHE